MMILGRAIQGFGAGGIFPVASAFIGDTFPPEKRGGALGIIGSVWGFSGILGPIIGALLLPYGWQWLFIINIPISALIIVLSFFILPASKGKEYVSFDWHGTIVFALMVASLALGVNQINTSNFFVSLGSLFVWPFLVISALLLPLLIKLERNILEPVIHRSISKFRGKDSHQHRHWNWFMSDSHCFPAFTGSNRTLIVHIQC